MPLSRSLPMPIVVGLTGGIGMGKSTATSFFRRCGFRVHDSDATVHELYGPGGGLVPAVSALFPSSLSAEGGIDRREDPGAEGGAGRPGGLTCPDYGCFGCDNLGCFGYTPFDAARVDAGRYPRVADATVHAATRG